MCIRISSTGCIQNLTYATEVLRADHPHCPKPSPLTRTFDAGRLGVQRMRFVLALPPTDTFHDVVIRSLSHFICAVPLSRSGAGSLGVIFIPIHLAPLPHFTPIRGCKPSAITSLPSTLAQTFQILLLFVQFIYHPRELMAGPMLNNDT